MQQRKEEKKNGFYFIASFFIFFFWLNNKKKNLATVLCEGTPESLIAMFGCFTFIFILFLFIAQHDERVETMQSVRQWIRGHKRKRYEIQIRPLGHSYIKTKKTEKEHQHRKIGRISIFSHTQKTGRCKAKLCCKRLPCYSKITSKCNPIFEHSKNSLRPDFIQFTTSTAMKINRMKNLIRKARMNLNKLTQIRFFFSSSSFHASHACANKWDDRHCKYKWKMEWKKKKKIMHVLTQPFLFCPNCRHCSEKRQNSIRWLSSHDFIYRWARKRIGINEDYESINCHFHFDESFGRFMQIFTQISVNYDVKWNATKQKNRSKHRIASTSIYHTHYSIEA